jgi:hypothetical protein
MTRSASTATVDIDAPSYCFCIVSVPVSVASRTPLQSSNSVYVPFIELPFTTRLPSISTLQSIVTGRPGRPSAKSLKLKTPKSTDPMTPPFAETVPPK